MSFGKDVNSLWCSEISKDLVESLSGRVFICIFSGFNEKSKKTKGNVRLVYRIKIEFASTRDETKMIIIFLKLF